MGFVKKQIQNDLEYQMADLEKYKMKNEQSSVRYCEGRIAGLKFALYLIELEEEKTNGGI